MKDDGIKRTDPYGREYIVYPLKKTKIKTKEEPVEEYDEDIQAILNEMKEKNDDNE